MVKVTTQNQEDAHRQEVIKGASIGGSIGVGIGLAGVLVASRRYPSFRQLTVPFRTFLVTSTGTFGAIVTAERRSLAFHQAHNPFTHYKDQASQDAAARRAAETIPQRALNWGRDNRYGIVFGSWVASMGLALAIVGRSRYLSTAQKIVQARVYAQGLTLLVLVVTAAFEASDAKKGKGRWETVMVLDPNDPEHKHLIEKRIHKEEYEGQDLWKDMVAAEERRLAARKQQGQ